ncbi:MAG: hypothetical protein WC248_04010 [Candidatus Methanomethylophilaceae archaeon]|jgi:predicted nucleic acid-binding Zn ribbon protein
MELREAANGIIVNIAKREKTDTIIPPMMVVLVLLSYAVIITYYATTMYREYGRDIPITQLFSLVALFTIGIGLIVALFYLLMSRNVKHSEREKELRYYMVEYADANNYVCGADISNDIQRLKDINTEILAEENPAFRKNRLLYIGLPAIAGTLALLFVDLETYAIQLVAICYGISIVLAMFIAPSITVFPRQHERRAIEFYDEFNDIAVCIGIKTEKFDRRIGYRSFWVFLLISALTLGAFLIYWGYLTFKDMNKHFLEQWYYEDCLFKSIKSTETYFVETEAERGKGYKLEDHWV